MPQPLPVMPDWALTGLVWHGNPLKLAPASLKLDFDALNTISESFKLDFDALKTVPESFNFDFDTLNSIPESSNFDFDALKGRLEGLEAICAALPWVKHPTNNPAGWSPTTRSLLRTAAYMSKKLIAIANLTRICFSKTCHPRQHASIAGEKQVQSVCQNLNF